MVHGPVLGVSGFSVWGLGFQGLGFQRSGVPGV